MAQTVACSTCGAAILVETASRTGGLCMPCKNGTRAQIDAGKEWAAGRAAREADPLRVLWVSLVRRVHDSASGTGFETLSEAEKLYYAVGLVHGDVYNGGFDQYFFNSSGSFYAHAVRGLQIIGATQSAQLLAQAKQALFGDSPVPTDIAERRTYLRTLSLENAVLDSLDAQFWEDPDDLGALMERFVNEHHLLTPTDGA
ncbi:MAG: DMP19 family protein [Myxococcales bacterium]|nr:DMP19 family protein [Myxococcales bacterium]